MGEIVGAGLLAHVPTIVLPEETRLELNEARRSPRHGAPGTAQGSLRAGGPDSYDTVVVLDSHWATTVEFVVTGQDRRAGLPTSEELPRGMCRMPYDFPGTPNSPRTSRSPPTGTRHLITAITPTRTCRSHRATINLWTYLGEGLPDKRCDHRRLPDR